MRNPVLYHSMPRQSGIFALQTPFQTFAEKNIFFWKNDGSIESGEHGHRSGSLMNGPWHSCFVSPPRPRDDEPRTGRARWPRSSLFRTRGKPPEGVPPPGTRLPKPADAGQCAGVACLFFGLKADPDPLYPIPRNPRYGRLRPTSPRQVAGHCPFQIDDSRTMSLPSSTRVTGV